jgi:hypothetical protein
MLYIPVIGICRYRGRVGTSLSVLWVAYSINQSMSLFPLILYTRYGKRHGQLISFCFDVVADVSMVSMAN